MVEAGCLLIAKSKNVKCKIKDSHGRREIGEK
jgi:hypothetical protein